MKVMVKKSSRKDISKRDIEQLLREQTAVILAAVDERLEKSQKGQAATILSEVDDRFEKFEIRFNKKLDQLMTTLDRFLKRLTDSEDEFIILKKDVNLIKSVIKEKLGVDLL